MEIVEKVLAGLAILLLVSTPISHGLKRAADTFYEHALTTPSTKDDEVGEKVVLWAEKVSKVLDWVSRVLPVISNGNQAQK